MCIRDSARFWQASWTLLGFVSIVAAGIANVAKVNRGSPKNERCRSFYRYLWSIWLHQSCLANQTKILFGFLSQNFPFGFDDWFLGPPSYRKMYLERICWRMWSEWILGGRIGENIEGKRSSKCSAFGENVLENTNFVLFSQFSPHKLFYCVYFDEVCVYFNLQA